MKKRVLILGASRYYSKSIEATRAAGYFVAAADKDPMAAGFVVADLGVQCDIVDKDRVLALAEELRIDGIIPVNDYGVPTAAHVSAYLGLPGISPEAAIWCTNKAAMRSRWQQMGVPCPRVLLASTPEEFSRAVEIVGLPFILKPAHGIGGASRGVIVVRTREELPDAVRFSQSFYDDKATLVESFVEAEIEHSAEVIVVAGSPQVIAIGDKVKTPLPYRVDKSVIYPTALDARRRAVIVDAVERAVEALDIRIGAAHVELATTADGCVLFELGARCGGGGTPEPVVHFATGIDEFVEVVRLLVGDEPGTIVPTRARGCVYNFLTPRPGRVKSVSGLDAVRMMDGILDIEVFVGPGSEIKPVTVGLDRSGFLIAGAATRSEAARLARHAEACLTFEYAS